MIPTRRAPCRHSGSRSPTCQRCPSDLSIRPIEQGQSRSTSHTTAGSPKAPAQPAPCSGHPFQVHMRRCRENDSRSGARRGPEPEEHGRPLADLAWARTSALPGLRPSFTVRAARLSEGITARSRLQGTRTEPGDTRLTAELGLSGGFVAVCVQKV